MLQYKNGVGPPNIFRLLAKNVWANHENMALVQNKKAYFNYEILEKFEAGIELLGFEVKALKQGHGSLEGSYVTIRATPKSTAEVFLVGTHISPYQPGNTPSEYDERRERRLLLNKKEIQSLLGFEKQKGLTIVPISVYNKGGKIKVEIAVARGKKKHDKRETLKKRDAEREMRRLKHKSVE